MVEATRPYVILKWAQTCDGFIARENFDSKWISNEESRMLVHQWRAEEDAILVGTNTAKYDNPKLNVRDWNGTDPIRIVIDKKLELSQNLSLFDGTQPTLVFNEIQNSENENLELFKIDFSNGIEAILTELAKRRVQSLIVEGGSATLTRWIESGLWDEARVFSNSVKFISGIKAPSLPLNFAEEIEIGADRLKIYYHE